MDDQAATKRPLRFQLRLATLFWLTFSAACFFAGRNWDSMSQKLSSLFPTRQTRILLTTGTSTLIPSTTKVPRFQIHNEAICQASPVSASQIQVSAVANGMTSVDLWDENGNVTTYYITVSK